MHAHKDRPHKEHATHAAKRLQGRHRPWYRNLAGLFVVDLVLLDWRTVYIRDLTNTVSTAISTRSDCGRYHRHATIFRIGLTARAEPQLVRQEPRAQNRECQDACHPC